MRRLGIDIDADRYRQKPNSNPNGHSDSNPPSIHPCIQHHATVSLSPPSSLPLGRCGISFPEHQRAARARLAWLFWGGSSYGTQITITLRSYDGVRLWQPLKPRTAASKTVDRILPTKKAPPPPRPPAPTAGPPRPLPFCRTVLNCIKDWAGKLDKSTVCQK